MVMPSGDQTFTEIMTDTTLILAKIEGEGERRGYNVGYEPTTISNCREVFEFLSKSAGNTMEDVVPFMDSMYITAFEILAAVVFSIVFTCRWGNETPPLL